MAQSVGRARPRFKSAQRESDFRHPQAVTTGT